MSEPRWILLIRAQTKIKTVAAIAKQCKVSRAALSGVLNGCGPYADGRASTRELEKKVLAALDNVVCPFLTEASGSACVISGEECRTYAGRVTPIQSPTGVQHWRACKECKVRIK